MKYIILPIIRILKLLGFFIAICLYAIGSIIVVIITPLAYIFTGKNILDWWFVDIFKKLP